MNKLKRCPKTVSGNHYFHNSGQLIGKIYVDECQFCGVIDDRKLSVSKEEDEKNT